MKRDRYIVLALGASESDLIAENEHATLRAARADVKRLIASKHKPQSVEIADERTGETVYTWDAARAAKGGA